MFTTGDYYKEVFQAKQEYFEKAGVVYEDDDEFENRMCIFMDWYIFDRDLPVSICHLLNIISERIKNSSLQKTQKFMRTFATPFTAYST